MATDPARVALSVVVPVYDEEGNVGPLHAEITAVAGALGVPYEIVFVNDGSRDGTLERLRTLQRRDPHLRIVDLDGNFGEAAALSAGFAHARGEIVVTLDGDGQNDPHDIPRLLAALQPGIDVVSGRRRHREERFGTRVLPSWIANRLIVAVTGVPVYDCGCGLKAYRRGVVAGVQLPRGMNRFLPAILGVRGDRVAEIETRDRPRGSGRSHYGLWRVAIVLRDLPSLPLLVRRPWPGRGAVRALAVATAVLGGLAVAAVATGRVDSGLLLGALAAIAAAVRHNLRRAVDASAQGVFRVRRVFEHGDVTSADRDRGGGLLGQEPPADLLRATGRGGHAAL